MFAVLSRLPLKSDGHESTEEKFLDNESDSTHTGFCRAGLLGVG
jgi:hypothetical protein